MDRVWTLSGVITPNGMQLVSYENTVTFSSVGGGIGTMARSECETGTFTVRFDGANSFHLGTSPNLGSCANPMDEGQRLGAIFDPDREVDWTVTAASLTLQAPNSTDTGFVFSDVAVVRRVVSTLEGRTWSLSGAVASAIAQPVRPTANTLRFVYVGEGRGTVIVSGCNDGNFSVTFDVTTLTIGPLRGSASGCDRPDDPGHALSDLISVGTRLEWNIDGARLTLESTGGGSGFQFDDRAAAARDAQALIGRTWTVSSMLRLGTVEAVDPRASGTLTFTADQTGTGTVTIDGCEHATYQIIYGDRAFALGRLLGEQETCAVALADGQQISDELASGLQAQTV